MWNRQIQVKEEMLFGRDDFKMFWIILIIQYFVT